MQKRAYKAHKSRFTTFRNFKRRAVRYLNEIYGRSDPLDFFDFGEKDGYYFAIGYRDTEDAPAEQKPGEPLDPKVAETVDKVEETSDPDQYKTDNDPGVPMSVVLNATDEAIKLAVEKGIDIKLVKGTGKDGNVKVGDVREYLKRNAPA